jgi:hypothetical protein
MALLVVAFLAFYCGMLFAILAFMIEIFLVFLLVI